MIAAAISAGGLGYCAAVVLAAVFASAAIAKLRDLPATLEQFTGLGLPRPGVFTRIVPLAELSLVILLLVVPAAGAIAALITLAFFTTFLVGRVRSGVVAPCACFGATVTTPLSWLDIARNLGLMALGILALTASRPIRPTLADLAVVVGATAMGVALLAMARRR